MMQYKILSAFGRRLHQMKNIGCLLKNSSSSIANKRQRLVIMGSGWGSTSVIRDIDGRLYDLIIISPRNHFVFTPLLASTTLGTLEFRSIVEPIHRLRKFKDEDELHISKALSVDFKAKEVEVRSAIRVEHKYKIKYDELVIGVGCNVMSSIPGVKQFAFPLKELIHARQIREKILMNFELAIQPGISEEEQKKLLHVIIVGGGPTGVEFGAELYDFYHQDLTKTMFRKEAKFVKVTLIESAHILGTFDRRLQAYAEKKIMERAEFNILKAKVKEVTADGVLLEDGTRLECGMTVWCSGIAPRQFTNNYSGPKSQTGRILVNESLQIVGDSHGCVYALGDCAVIEKNPLPCTAQVADREGRYLAKLLNAKAKGLGMKPFEFKSAGMLAYIGGYVAVSDLKDVKLHGPTSWLLWRSAYWTRLATVRLMIQVPMNWFVAFFFGRDTCRF